MCAILAWVCVSSIMRVILANIRDADSSDDDFELVNKPVYSFSDIGQDSGSGDYPGSMDSEQVPITPFQSASLVSTEDNLGTEAENVVTTPLESEQLVPHSDLIPGILESETTAANQAPEETNDRPPVEVSELLESGEPSHSDRLFTESADPEAPDVPADVDVPPEGKPAVPPEGKPADTESPPIRKPADTDSPAERKPADTESPPIRKPADTDSPEERKPAEEHIPPSEGVTKRELTTEKSHTLENPPSSPSYPPPVRGHSLQSVSIFIYLLLPVFAVTLLILILYFVT